ncbi:phage portal protein [Dactylosporangium sp. NPDC000521]|uniref:phage portal protein n=1 Tax=Dactylosporangium sp. NPDC000521 TaxID=3363975 RepID=UPI003696900F
MPLPDKPDSAWPPRWLDPVLDKIGEWTAWYRGDPVKLAKQYEPKGSQLNRPRTFWGEQVPDGQRPAKLHVPLARDIATTSSRLLYSEPPTLTVVNAQAQKRLDQLVDDGVHATLLAAAEVTAGKGGGFLRIVWDRSLLDRPWIARVDPAAGVPEWRWSRLAALTVWRELGRDNRRVIRYLERHDPGTIQHAVYEGTDDMIGRRIDLGAYPDTAWLVGAEGVTITDNIGAISTGLDDRLTAVYTPNVTPAPCWDDVPGAAALGRSDLDGVEPLLDVLDETWSNLTREMRLAVARLMVPEEYLRSLGPGKGATFDVARELMTPVKTMADDDKGLNIELIQPEIRVEQHLRMVEAETRTIVQSAGYSAQSFGMDGGGNATATEVTARERTSFIGRDAKLLGQRSPVAEITETLQMIDVKIFGSGITPELPDVQFGDSVSQDPESMARTLQAYSVAEAISTWEKVKTRRPDWDDTQIGVEVDRILKETGKSVENPDTFTGSPPAPELPGQVDDPAPPA